MWFVTIKDKRSQTPQEQEQHTVLSVRQTQESNVQNWYVQIHTNGAQNWSSVVQTLYFSPFVVDLSSYAKYGKPYWDWPATSITVLIASLEAAARALLKWYIPLSVCTYTRGGVVACLWVYQNEKKECSEMMLTYSLWIFFSQSHSLLSSSLVACCRWSSISVQLSHTANLQ